MSVPADTVMGERGFEMTDPSRGPTPTDPTDEEFEEVSVAWAALEEGLASYLGTMVDPEEDDTLIIELAGPSDEAGCLPYAQFGAFGDGQSIRAEIAGDAHLRAQYEFDEVGCRLLRGLGWRGNDAGSDDECEANWYRESPVADAAEIAGQVVQVMRFCFAIPHPQLLTYDAWGPAASGAGVLGLCATDDVPVDEPGPPSRPRPQAARERGRSPLVLEPAGRDELVTFVASLLREKYGEEPTVDEDGDFVLECMDEPVWVRVRSEQPAVEIMTQVAHGVQSLRAASVEVGLLNRDYVWAKWRLVDRTVWQTVVLPARPFAPGHLDFLLDQFFGVLTSTRDDLVLRLGAKVG